MSSCPACRVYIEDSDSKYIGHCPICFSDIDTNRLKGIKQLDRYHCRTCKNKGHIILFQFREPCHRCLGFSIYNLYRVSLTFVIAPDGRMALVGPKFGYMFNLTDPPIFHFGPKSSPTFYSIKVIERPNDDPSLAIDSLSITGILPAARKSFNITQKQYERLYRHSNTNGFGIRKYYLSGSTVSLYYLASVRDDTFMNSPNFIYPIFPGKELIGEKFHIAF